MARRKTTAKPPTGESKDINLADVPFATDGVAVPTLYADVIKGTAIFGGIARLNLVEFKIDALDGDLKGKHVVTIVLPVEQIRAWATYLTKIADETGL